ncbi:hypothetical protein [Pseudomonas tohonis]|uniref:hypothetical protein n=1 Tax=Pseudomonas tohonis TaxID=2725477 RepID=UPI001F1D45BF|nr:hypothetical protein [Pseudomonas tohonis]
MRLYLLVQSSAGMLVPPHRLAQVGGAVVAVDRDDVPFTPIQWEPMHASATTRSQRLNLDFRARMRAAAAASPLRAQVDATLAEIDRRKAEGIKPDRQTIVIQNERGTPCLADWIVH